MRRHAHGASQALFFNACITVRGLTWRTRALSQSPRPLRLISTLVRLTSGTIP
jgi:hypothetical protein